MKVEKNTSPTGQWGLRAVPEDYDGIPLIPLVQFDRQPRVLSPDRVALAGYLLFGPWMSGRYNSPQWHSPAVSQAMAGDCGPAWLQTEPVELYAKPLPKGRHRVRVHMEGTAFEEKPCGRSESGRALRFMRSDRSAGARLSFSALELSTNAWMLAVGQAPDRQLRVLVGCAVLFAEDMDIDEILICNALQPDEISSLGNLVGAARLGLAAVD